MLRSVGNLLECVWLSNMNDLKVVDNLLRVIIRVQSSNTNNLEVVDDLFGVYISPPSFEITSDALELLCSRMDDLEILRRFSMCLGSKGRKRYVGVHRGACVGGVGKCMGSKGRKRYVGVRRGVCVEGVGKCMGVLR
ncbi:hypothetical protein VNO78_20558 [Psophocarpus tetragonolobus]|uniref:Uncharacterized protein n=1 Tax=Psophocarpus tetragonolobus TaxID=3891 RepID=A0AAN9S9E9_PSOTE